MMWDEREPLFQRDPYDWLEFCHARSVRLLVLYEVEAIVESIPEMGNVILNVPCGDMGVVLGWTFGMPPMIRQTFGIVGHPAQGIRIPLPPLKGRLPEMPAKKCDDYTLPVCSWLAERHPHVRDGDVDFQVNGHVYRVRGCEVGCSVTSLIGSYSEALGVVKEFLKVCQVFDADRAITLMKSGSRWPRAEYMRDGTVMSDCAIKELWRSNGVQAAAAGTWMHAQCEVILNGGFVVGECPELALFRVFLGSTSPLLAYRSEWVIWAGPENVAGCIDFVAMDMLGQCVLYDWKRTRGLSGKYQNQWRSMRSPLEHLDDVVGNKYRLQLNVYRWILERYYNLRVVEMFVVCLHPELGLVPFIDEVPDMQAEVEDIMAARSHSLAGASV